MRQDIRERIIEYLKDNGQKATMQIAYDLGLKPRATRYYLGRLELEGKVQRVTLSPKVVLWKLLKR